MDPGVGQKLSLQCLEGVGPKKTGRNSSLAGVPGRGGTVRNKARRENGGKQPINEDLSNFACLEHFIVRTEQRNENSLGQPCGVGGTGSGHPGLHSR